MNRRQREAYQIELKRVTKHLGLAQTGDLEDAIIAHCLNQLREWAVAYGNPDTLSELADHFATSLGMQLTEVRGQEDIDALLGQVAPEQKAVIANLKTELGDDTDAVTILRMNRKPWDQVYLAVINCQDWHEFRRYFSKWHEIVHRLIEGQQLTFAFRHTKVTKLEPEEILVDRIAAALAFYPDIFEPIAKEEIERDGRLTFAAIDRIRNRVVPDASREATALACVQHLPRPAWFLRCGMGLKAGEARRVNSPQTHMFEDEPPEEKLRVRIGAPTPAGKAIGVRFYPNMQVPEGSVVARIFHDPQGITEEAREYLEDWSTSSGGPIGYGVIDVEAERVGNDEVWVIIHTMEQS